MGFGDFLLRFLRQKKEPETIQSLDQSLEALESPKGNDSITYPTSSYYKDVYIPNVTKPSTQSTLLKPAEIDESSFKLGVASGYTGHSIRNIESALNRIETQMVTRDWFNVEFEDKTPILIKEIEKLHQEMQIHEKNEEKRAEIIQNILERMRNVANFAPNEVKFQLLDQIKAVESQLPLTKKMEELVSLVKSGKEISYDELAAKLSITISALRGLLSTTAQRTNKIERFMVDGKGWVRFKEA
jgi:O6-methylguanine-DNA--protein-cysteine methyltransferase